MVDILTSKSCLILITIVPVVLALTACSDRENEASPLSKPLATIEEMAVIPDEPVVITIGSLADITGPGANAVTKVNMALEDLAAYYNQNNLIPGIRLKVVTYDGQMDPAKDIPGYEWLREKGADFIFTSVPATPVSLKPRVDSDEMVMFAVAGSKEGFLPPGYVFNLGIDPQYEAYTLMKWIAENDWDYATKGPAKIGGAAWAESYSDTLLDAMEEYCSVHPDQFEWEGGYLTHFGFTWGAEVEALKDCDYVYPGIIMQNFVKQYREAGHTEAKFVGSDSQAVFLGMIDTAGLWNEIDGMLFLKTSRWWNEEGEIINLTRQLVEQYHQDDAEEIIHSGNGYLSVNQLYPMFKIIADAAETVGPQNLDSQALYNAATSMTFTIDAVQRASFTEVRLGRGVMCGNCHNLGPKPTYEPQGKTEVKTRTSSILPSKRHRSPSTTPARLLRLASAGKAISPMSCSSTQKLSLSVVLSRTMR